MALEKADLEAIQKLVDDAVAGAGENITGQAQSAVDAAIAAATAKLKFPTAEEIQATVNSALKSAQDAAADKAAADKTAGEKQAAREAWLAANAAKLPPAYRAGIVGDDEATLAAKLAEAQAAFQADIASGQFGIKASDVGGAAPAKPGAAGIDASKLNPAQKITAGLEALQKK